MRSEDRDLYPESLASPGSAWDKPKASLICSSITEDTSVSLVCILEIKVLKLHSQVK